MVLQGVYPLSIFFIRTAWQTFGCVSELTSDTIHSSNHPNQTVFHKLKSKSGLFCVLYSEINHHIAIDMREMLSISMVDSDST